MSGLASSTQDDSSGSGEVLRLTAIRGLLDLGFGGFRLVSLFDRFILSLTPIVSSFPNLESVACCLFVLSLYSIAALRYDGNEPGTAKSEFRGMEYLESDFNAD